MTQRHNKSRRANLMQTVGNVQTRKGCSHSTGIIRGAQREIAGINNQRRKQERGNRYDMKRTANALTLMRANSIQNYLGRGWVGELERWDTRERTHASMNAGPTGCSHPPYMLYRYCTCTPVPGFPLFQLFSKNVSSFFLLKENHAWW